VHSWSLVQRSALQRVISIPSKYTSTSTRKILNYFRTLLIKAAVNFDPTSMLSQNQTLLVGFGIYVVPFLIGLALSLTIWLCLCCCCTCPNCCPSKCCQHDETILYTKCEMLWPAIFLMLVLLLACAASIPGIILIYLGITKASTLTDSIATMQCGISLSLDDLLNGNVTSDNSSFFIGASTLVTYLGNFKTNITNIINNFSNNLQTGVNNVQSNCSSAITNLEILSNGVTHNATYSLIYNTPTTLSGSSVSSTFGTVLGVPSNSSSMVGAIYTVVTTLYNAMTTMSTAITSLNNANATIMTSIQSASDSIANYSSIISGVDTSLGSTFTTIAPYLNYIRIAFLTYYGLVLGLSVLALLGVIIMACFDKPGCRHLMYVACVIMFIATIVGFLLSFLLSFLIPILYMGCSVITPAIASSTNFVSNCL
jgi:hypothetical protein